jgi:hypothetical protein
MSGRVDNREGQRRKSRRDDTFSLPYVLAYEEGTMPPSL